MTTATPVHKNSWWPFLLMLLPFGLIISGIVIYVKNPKGTTPRKAFWYTVLGIFALGFIRAYAA